MRRGNLVITVDWQWQHSKDGHLAKIRLLKTFVGAGRSPRRGQSCRFGQPSYTLNRKSTVPFLTSRWSAMSESNMSAGNADAFCLIKSSTTCQLNTSPVFSLASSIKCIAKMHVVISTSRIPPSQR